MLGPQPSRWHRCTSFTVTDSRSSYENVAAAEEEDWKARGRLRAALRGFREVDAQMLELVLWGYDDDNAANEALQRQFDQIVRQG